jgi:Coenzyme F420 hydrogenase/dehydrogenase, beta subunit C terminus.
MKEDKDGFIYPEVDKNICIDCGKCKSVCPFATSEKLKHKKAEYCYALQLNDKKELFKSASGGAFGAIVKAYCDKNFIIFGAEMCGDLKVRHTAAETIENSYKFKKSKYLKSDTYGIYPEVKKALAGGKKVLFSGVGCQVAGLKGYLGKEYDNLLTVDLVCHGTPSQKIFEYYLKYLEKNIGAK